MSLQKFKRLFGFNEKKKRIKELEREIKGLFSKLQDESISDDELLYLLKMCDEYLKLVDEMFGGRVDYVWKYILVSLIKLSAYLEKSKREFRRKVLGIST
ncbi:hypothetical protein DRJ17_04110 [Candidatus Woesearchaeota archaeon]|nr:MAG: hypothetical protein DRJ17_04110 [Candidatus Woesearchaeota archaeon]